MARLLVRAGKDPFTAVAAETTLTQDVFNSNSGNHLFQHAVWRTLATDDAELVANSTLSERRPPGPGDAERINESFEHFVVPMANAFRPEFSRQLANLTELIEGLTIPVTVVGIGSQAPHGQGPETLEAIADPVRRFVSAVLDRSATIGVRGDFTRRHLRTLGFGDDVVDVIGCPSLFLWGRDFKVERRVDHLTEDSPLALNLTPEVPGIGGFATAQAARHPHLTYVGQDAHDLRLMLWGTPFPHVDDPTVPVHVDHPLYAQDRMRLFLDTWSWYDFMAERDFAYGTRFHGNVAALLGGTPAMLLAHDSRTLELAEYHRMPHRVVPSFDQDLRAQELHDACDLGALNDELPNGFDRYTAFLERNGLRHRWQPGSQTSAFDAQLDAAELPGAVRTLAAPGVDEVASRLRWLRDGMVLDITRHPRRYDAPFPHPPWQGAGSRHAKLLAQGARRDERLRADVTTLKADDKALRAEVKALRADTAALKKRLEAVERSFWRRVAGRLRRLLRRG